MAKRPDNIWSWLLARWFHHQNIYKGPKEVSFNDLLTMIMVVMVSFNFFKPQF